jgi:small subunit ribosomal protein S3
MDKHMGKKINPKIFRIKNIINWESRWFADKEYAKFLEQDILIKEYLYKKLLTAFVAKIEIERAAKQLTVIIHSARPGMIIGKGGVGIEAMKKTISRKYVKNKDIKVNVTIKEVSKPNLDAALVAQGIKFDIEKRIPYRRAMKQAISKVEKSGALGIKVIVAGRLNGADIARSEMLVSGKIPLHTLRANISYADEIAYTTYGVIGIKVWIYKGNIFKKEKVDKELVPEAVKPKGK